MTEAVQARLLLFTYLVPPGPGKGPYDGIGGRWKRKIDQCMSSAEIEKLVFTDIGYIHTVKDIYLALDYYFG